MEYTNLVVDSPKEVAVHETDAAILLDKFPSMPFHVRVIDLC